MDLLLLLAVAAAAFYGCYRALLHTLEQATRTRRYLTTAEPAEVEDAFKRAMHWPVANESGPAVVVAPGRLGLPEVLCIVDDPVEDRRKVHIGMDQDSARAVGRNNALGGMIGAFFEARGISSRLDGVETELRRVDPQIVGLG